jgi:hypothetical protein
MALLTCAHCAYCTDRRFNLRRHTRMVHGVDKIECLSVGQKVAISSQNATTPSQFATTPSQNATTPSQFATTPSQNATTPSQNATTTCKPFQCTTCYKTFTTSYAMQRHTCKQLSHPHECPQCHIVLSSSGAKCRHMKSCKGLQLMKQKASPASIATTNNINSQINNIQTQNNNNIGTQNVIININNFGQEDMSHITDDYKNMCIQAINGLGVKMLVQKTHFDPNVPENHNVRIKSTKLQQVQVREDDRWAIKDSDDAVDSMMMKSCKRLMDHYYDSSIKEEDASEHNSLMIQNLMNIRMRNPPVYHRLRRQIFAMICDAQEKLAEEEKETTQK